jgi:ribosome recycling factor
MSGEALAGPGGYGIDPTVLRTFAAEVKDVHALGCQLALVIGGGNIFRGLEGADSFGIDRATGDYMGMLATVINALALQAGLEQVGVPTRVLSAIEIKEVAEPYIRRRATRHLEKGRVIIFARGHRQSLLHHRHGGEPPCDGDRRAGHLQGDPRRRCLRQRSAEESQSRPLRSAHLHRRAEPAPAGDGSTACPLCMDNGLPILVFNMLQSGNIKRAVVGRADRNNGPRRSRAMTAEVLESLKTELDKTHAALKKELSHVRTGRASTALLEGVHVDYYGTRTPLNQLASLSAPEASLLVIQPYDKSVMQAIEKAIQTSELGLNPQNDGKLIRIPIPPLTEERRRDLVKHVRKVAEEFRVGARNHRRESLEMLKELEKDKDITEDDRRHADQKVEAMTKECLERLEKTLKLKEDEIMAV